MSNFMKLVCVILALVIALSVTSCSLTKQYSFKDDEVEVPVGVYIYCMYRAYTEAASLTEVQAAYNESTKKYNGNTSFLKVKVTDDNGDTITAEQWIKNKTEEYFRNTVAILYEFEQVGATLDEFSASDKFEDFLSTVPYSAYYSNYSMIILSDLYSSNNEASYSSKTKMSEMASRYEKFGIGYDSWLTCMSVYNMYEAAFEAEYGADGPSAVSDEELINYYTDTYTTYSVISANLYTPAEQTTDEYGNTTTEGENTAFTDEEIAQYKSNFESYAQQLNEGAAMDAIAEQYVAAYEIDADTAANIPEDKAEKIEDDTEDEIQQAVLQLEEGKASYITVGEGNSQQIYLIYRTSAKDKATELVGDETNRLSLLKEMKEEDFDDLLESIIDDNNIKPSSACNNYKPKLFDKRK